MQQATQPPKVFISYSWSSQEHEAWVIQLATDLEESGAHVLIYGNILLTNSF